MRHAELKLILICALLGSWTAEAKDPWRSSAITYRNEVSTLTLNNDELTDNPYYAMTLSVRPQWWFGDSVYVHARFAISQELTNSDITTNRGETWPTDLTFRVGAASFYTIPVVDISFSADMDVITPTSPVSRARTLQLGVAPGIGVRGNYDVLGGLSVGYGFRSTFLAHESTTAQREVPKIPACAGSIASCGLDMGLRNSRMRLSHSFDVSMMFTSWIGVAASGAMLTDYLYDLPATDARVSTVPQEPEDRRFLVATDLALVLKPMKSLGIRIGAETVNPQLAPDSSTYTPFINRYTSLYFDLSLDVAGLVTQIRGDR